MSFKRAGIFSPNPLTTRGVSTKLSAQKDKIVYTNGKVVIIRDLNNPASSTAYTEHVKDPTVARISPSGYYCASADISGTVRVWDTVGEDRTLKGEYKVIGGRINDIAWDGESKRIIAVGDGKEKFGHAFMMDTGTSSGEIIGHSKAVNAVSIRQQRPFRAATAGDDSSIIFHQGVPYKYDKVIKTHTKFVQDVRYDNTGDRFASVGSDSKVFLYDGKTGDTLGEITDSPHKGSIMACSWSPDSSSLVTSSADCTVKLWDVETKKGITTWTIGSGVSHQQGPQKSITSITPSKDSGTFLAGSTDGRILSFSTATSESDSVDGEGHTNLVSGLATSPDGTVYSIAYDDKVKEIVATGQSFTDASATLSSQPRSVAVASDSTVFVTEIKSIEAFRSNQKIHTHQPKYSPHAVAASGVLVAIGGDDQKVHLYQWDGKALKETTVLDGNKGTVSALAFSPDSKYIASGDLVTSRWSFHSARVNSLSWTSESRHCASGSLDTHVYVWSVERPMKNIAIKNAGPGGVNVVLWTSEDAKTSKLVSGGADGCLRVWEVTFHA
ncbi:hypothetical protein CCMSSC00406_0005745 [Pleurotus cornucopiae]|uniref:Uncharacterized protein n=1 Tax=Pleurotus cornucopiae TaxID=5321 RepID=A0ACB7IVB5_PLECO|nr:hypothetical protein CCMSSC00406_0005745 [Pleurotus cornucopiae]